MIHDLLEGKLAVLLDQTDHVIRVCQVWRDLDDRGPSCGASAIAETLEEVLDVFGLTVVRNFRERLS